MHSKLMLFLFFFQIRNLIEKEVIKTVYVEKEIPIEKIVEVTKEVVVEKVVEVIKEVPIFISGETIPQIIERIVEIGKVVMHF